MHEFGFERVATNSGKRQQRIEQALRQPGIGAHVGEQANSLRRHLFAVIGLQRPDQLVHGQQGWTQVLRQCLGDCRQFIVGRLEFGCFFHDASAFAALPVVDFNQPGVQHAAFDQQHHEQETRCQQAEHPADVKAQIEAAGIEANRQRELEQQRTHDDHQPDVNRGMGASLPQCG